MIKDGISVMSEKTAPKFGPGGNSESFKRAGFKSTVSAPSWLDRLGLDAYEYECGNGIIGTPELFTALGKEAKNHGISLSLHAPYFISLSGTEEEKRLNSVGYISRSVEAAELMGAGTVVIHCGSCAKISREEAMTLSADTLSKALETIETDVLFGVETMGKINQLGTLEEVIELCRLSPRLSPVVDFGHLNARNLGGYFKTADDYRRVFDNIGNSLGDDKAKNLHCHFSKIMYTEKGGEKMHLTFADTVYGPEFEPLAEAIVIEGVCPTVICESAGTQAEDALTMKKMWEGRLNS